MRIRVLGSVALVPAHDGDPGVVLASRLRRLLAALVVHSNAVVSVDALADAVWGEDQPASPEGALHNLVSRLRSALRTTAGTGEDVGPAVLTRAPGYELRVSPADLDALHFEHRARHARSLVPHDPSAAVAVLTEALAWWRGPAYAEFADDDFARPEAARLEGLRATALEDHADALLALGRHQDAVPLLEGLLATDPLRERAQGRLMLALYRGDRQAQALDLFAAYRERLADDLGIDPSSDLQRLQQQILRQDPGLDGPSRGPQPDRPVDPGHPGHLGRGNLPPAPQTLVGRDDELAALVEAARPGELLTLTGPGGVGKTSLALEAAARLQEQYPDGAWFCDLSALTAADDLPLAVMSALDLRAAPEPDRVTHLLTSLRPRRLLLVLDNCEHLLGAAAAVVHEVHRHCREVTVLATSRAALDVDDERVLRVPPLAVADSVRLFVERTRRRVRGFEIGDADASRVAEICRRLDGLPLAIELAAARMATMTPTDLMERLSWRFRLLHGGVRSGGQRHRTLGALVDWSFDLLDQQHRDVFEVLSLFAGTFDLDDATRLVQGVPELAAATDEARVADLVLGLADRSMLTVTVVEGRSRYSMLETLRAYGRDRLGGRGHAVSARHAHARLVVEVTEAAVARLYGPGHVEASAQIGRHLDELRAAHSWALVHDLPLAVRLVAALPLYVEHRMPVEIPQWAERTIDAAQGSDPPVGLAGVHAVAAAGARFTGDLRHAADLVGRGLQLPGDPPTTAYLRSLLGEVALFEGRLDDADQQRKEVAALAGRVDVGPAALIGDLLEPLVAAYRGDVERASEAAERIEERATRVGAGPVRAWARYIRGEAVLESDPAAAAELLDSALALARDQGDRYAAGAAMVSAASARARLGDPARAVPLFREAVAHWADAGDWTHQWTSLRGVVDVLVRLERDEEAAVLLGALANRSDAAPAFGPDAERMAVAESLLRQRLGDDVLSGLVGRGAEMSDDDVVGFAAAALAEEDRLSPAGRTGRS